MVGRERIYLVGQAGYPNVVTEQVTSDGYDNKASWKSVQMYFCTGRNFSPSSFGRLVRSLQAGELCLFKFDKDVAEVDREYFRQNMIQAVQRRRFGKHKRS